MPMTSLEMIKYLKRNGFIEVSQNVQISLHRCKHFALNGVSVLV